MGIGNDNISVLSLYTPHIFIRVLIAVRILLAEPAFFYCISDLLSIAVYFGQIVPGNLRICPASRRICFQFYLAVIGVTYYFTINDIRSCYICVLTICF